jgi:hypothetical protein
MFCATGVSSGLATRMTLTQASRGRFVEFITRGWKFDVISVPQYMIVVGFGFKWYTLHYCTYIRSSSPAVLVSPITISSPHVITFVSTKVPKRDKTHLREMCSEPGSLVSIMSGYGLDDRTIEVRSPAGAKDFSSSLCVQSGSGAHQASCTMDTGGPFPGGKTRPGGGVDHSPPSSAEVVNE